MAKTSRWIVSSAAAALLIVVAVAAAYMLNPFGGHFGSGGGVDPDDRDKVALGPEIWAVLSYIKSRWPEGIRARHDQLAK